MFTFYCKLVKKTEISEEETLFIKFKLFLTVTC